MVPFKCTYRSVCERIHRAFPLSGPPLAHRRVTTRPGRLLIALRLLARAPAAPLIRSNPNQMATSLRPRCQERVLEHCVKLCI
jgi:hypothetical protein